MRRRAILFAFMTLAALGMAVLPGVFGGSYASFTDNESITGSAQAGYWIGSITIVKVAQPEGSQSFSFTSTNLNTCDADNAFALVDNNSVGPDRKVCELDARGDTLFIVTEPGETGWDLTDIDCDDDPNVTIGASGGYDSGDNYVSIDLEPQDDITCTFTNTLNSATFDVSKVYSPVGPSEAVTVNLSCLAGTVVSNDLSASPGSPAQFTVTGIPSGGTTCTASENSVPTGYTASGCTSAVPLAANGTASCTITNTLNSATLTVTKAYVGTDGGAVGIHLTCSAGTIVDPTADGDADDEQTSSNTATFQVTGLSASTNCTATEPSVPAGYSQTATTCNPIAVGPTGTASCTITNTQQAGSITVIKDAKLDNGGEFHGDDFTFNTTGSSPALSPSTFTLDDDNNADSTNLRQIVFNTLGSGTYVIQEDEGPLDDLPVAWSISKITCTGATSVVYAGADADIATNGFETGDTKATITFAAGQTVTCTFENTEIPPGCVGLFTQPNPDRVFVPPGGAPFSALNHDQIVIGTDGDDVIFGNQAKDCILGLGGDDFINGGNGKDYLIGGPGNDTLIGGTGSPAGETADGGAGTDACDAPIEPDCEFDPADLDVTVAETYTGGGSQDIASPGYEARVRYTLSNGGPSALGTITFQGSVTLNDVTPTGLTGTFSIVNIPAGWTCSTPTATTWSCSGPLASGASVNIDMRVVGTGSAGDSIVFTPTVVTCSSPHVCLDDDYSNGNTDASDLKPSDTDTLT